MSASLRNTAAKPGPARRSVLITGASSGIGYSCSLDMAARGWRVFAAVRKEADAATLTGASSGKITPVIMDIIDYESVKKAAREVGERIGGAGLDALFNNAGISVQGPTEIVPIGMFEQQMRVNVFGHLFVTQTFLPLIRRARGRIVFMSSESGRITFPMMGPYSASKFALEAMANALRIELLPSRIWVSLVEAATIKTPMWDKIDNTTEKLLATISPELKELYRTELDTLVHFPKKQAESGIPMKKAVRVIRRALTSRRPKARYLIGWEARMLIFMHRVLPVRIVDWISSKAVRILGRMSKPK